MAGEDLPLVYSHEELDRLIEEELAARPWYVRAADWWWDTWPGFAVYRWATGWDGEDVGEMVGSAVDAAGDALEQGGEILRQGAEVYVDRLERNARWAFIVTGIGALGYGTFLAWPWIASLRNAGRRR